MKSYLNQLKSSRNFRIFGWFLLIFFPLLCQFVLEWFNFNNKVLLKYYIVNHPLPALFSTLLIIVIYLLLLFIFRRGWLAALILGMISVLFGMINYIKSALNGNHFYPWDFGMTGDIKELLDFTSITIPWQDMALIVFVIIIIFCLWLLGVSLPRSPLYRIIEMITLAILLEPVVSILKQPLPRDVINVSNGFSRLHPAIIELQSQRFYCRVYHKHTEFTNRRA